MLNEFGISEQDFFDLPATSFRLSVDYIDFMRKGGDDTKCIALLGDLGFKGSHANVIVRSRKRS
jgi:hypothetical protein